MSKSIRIDNKEIRNAEQNARKIIGKSEQDAKTMHYIPKPKTVLIQLLQDVSSKTQHTPKKPSFTFLNNKVVAETNSLLIK